MTKRKPTFKPQSVHERAMDTRAALDASSPITTHMGQPIDPAANHKRRPRFALPKDVRRLVGKTPHLIRATADVSGTLHQLCLNPRSLAIRDWLRRDLAETAGRALALLATLDGGAVSPGDKALVNAHMESYLKNP